MIMFIAIIRQLKVQGIRFHQDEWSNQEDWSTYGLG